MDEKEFDPLLNELNEIEDTFKENGLFDAFKPDWADCSDDSLEVGTDYVYYLTDEICMRGHVLYNDGVTAILKIVNRYEECYFYVVHYQELKQFFPAFTDTEATRLSEYFFIDVETQKLLFERDTDDEALKCWQEDESGRWELCEDLDSFWMGRMKKKFLYELKKHLKEREEENKKEEEPFDTTISIDLTVSALDDMYKEYDQEHGDKKSENDLSYSLSRSIQWLNNRSCAFLSAWRGYYSRKENDSRNHKLQLTLRECGYGVIRVKGCYAEIGKAVERENSFLVVDLNDSDEFMDNIYKQSELYEQDCFLLKPKDDHIAYLIGTNDDFGKGEIQIAGVMRINSNSSNNYSEISTGKISFEKNSF